MPTDTWDQTVKVATEAGVIKAAPADGAYRTDLADAARALVTGDVNGAAFTKGTVTVTEGGK